MIPSTNPLSKSICFLLACLAVLFAPPVRALEWITPAQEELSATAPQIDPDAGAEILHRIKQIDSSGYTTSATDEYVRIKIFNEKGVRQFDKIEIETGPRQRLHSLEARVIKPDGAIIDVEQQAFYDRDAIKSGDVKVRVRAFSFPQLAAGDIAEYKYSIINDENIMANVFFILSGVPTRRVLFRLKPPPLLFDEVTMAYFYKCAEQKMQMDEEGFNYVSMEKLPAFVREPFMEPESDVQPCIIFHPMRPGVGLGVFWGAIAGAHRERSERHVKKPSKLVAQTAARIVVGASTPEEKLARINDYCRTQILNYSVHESNDPSIDKIRKKDNRSPDELIKTKLGNNWEIPVLFVALARSQGINARIALCADKRNGEFKVNMPAMAYSLRDMLAAVNIDGKWKMYDPAHDMAGTGMLQWQNEGVQAMIVLAKGFKWVVTEKTAASRSVTKRTATMRLNDDGTLTGDASIEYSGHAEIVARHLYHSETDKKIEQLVRDDVQSRLPNAEVTDIRLANKDDVLKPLVLTYSVKIPGYAERTGQRLFIQPAFFSKGEPVRFTAEERRQNVFFKYAETFEDNVTIRMPDGFRLEEGSAPPGLPAGSWGYYKVGIGMKKSENSIIYKREFSFSPLLVPREYYKGVKHIFDLVRLNDSHMLTFRAEAE